MPQNLRESPNTKPKNTPIFSEVKCNICLDTGLVHPNVNGKIDYSQSKPCICRLDEAEKRKREALIRYCELPPMVDKMTFSNFEIYPEVKPAFDLAMVVAKNPTQLWWVTFQGLNDTGKTHLAISICRAAAEHGVSAKYAFVPLLLDELREGFKAENNDYAERFDRFCNVPLLVLDDLGAESSTAWVQEKLETLVDYRYMHKLSLIVTTNKTIDEMTPRLGSRLARHPNAILVSIMAREYTLRRMKK